MRSISKLGLFVFSILAVTGQDFPYVFQRFAGVTNIGDGGPAASAVLNGPRDVELDSVGNIYVLDSLSKRIRKVALDGTISTVVQLNFEGLDMFRTVDGTFYVTASAQIWKVSPNGTVSSIAGNGVSGASADGTPAVSATLNFRLPSITLDKSGLVYFIESNGIRRIKADGTLETVAGAPSPFGSANGFVEGSALGARFNSPSGLAFDAAGILYIADTGNLRIRRLQNGSVNTIAGTVGIGVTDSGPMATSKIGTPQSLTFDAAGNLFFFDSAYYMVYKITGNTVSRVGGNLAFGYADGPALNGFLGVSGSLAVDASGAIYVPQREQHRVRKIANGIVSTFAGRLHSEGDGGAASSALLGLPKETVLGTQGSVLIGDAGNYRVRRVAANGTISTIAGSGVPYNSVDNGQFVQPQLYSGKAAVDLKLRDGTYLAADKQGNVYIAFTEPVGGGGGRILRVDTEGIVSMFAGTGASQSAGDGGSAGLASFGNITCLSVDTAGNVYVCDRLRLVRKIDANGTIRAFAGTDGPGLTTDGGPAATTKIVVFNVIPDGQGNVYINSDSKILRVTPDGIIHDYIGNSTEWIPTDGVKVTGNSFEPVSAFDFDAAGNMYLVGGRNPRVYKMDTNGIVRTIAGGGTGAIASGVSGTSTVGLLGQDIDVDSGGDMYVTDRAANVVWKLVQNPPTGISVTGGNNQTGAAGLDLPVPVKVQLSGRAGVPPEGVTVNFAVTSGSATLSSATAKTDATGEAAVRVRPGAAGPITVTATVPGTSLPSVRLSLTGIPGTVCPLVLPTISDVHSLSEWGNFTRFASGSYLEIKGSNLAQGTRLWGGADFQGSNAPITMDGASVLINGTPAFTYYISPGQLNVQAPGDAAIGNVRITVSNCGGTSAPFTMQKAAIAPGLLAPGSFNVGGKQYLVALFPGGQTFVGRPNLIAGASFREVKPGESITAYGIGFGDTTPAISPGVITAGQNAIPGLTIAFGSTPAVVSYKGLAPGTVGLYQFDFTVPDVADGDQEIVVKVGSTQVQQTLFLTVKR